MGKQGIISIKRLNTSHVLINLPFPLYFDNFPVSLNTSHVLINRRLLYYWMLRKTSLNTSHVLINPKPSI